MKKVTIKRFVEEVDMLCTYVDRARQFPSRDTKELMKGQNDMVKVLLCTIYEGGLKA